MGLGKQLIHGGLINRWVCILNVGKFMDISICKFKFLQHENTTLWTLAPSQGHSGGKKQVSVLQVYDFRSRKIKIDYEKIILIKGKNVRIINFFDIFY